MHNETVLDCLVVGAGQSGLIMGYLLQQAGLNYQIIDKAPQCGGAWHGRPSSLHLFTPRRFSGLSPMPMPGDPNGYPNSAEMAGYLVQYANNAELNTLLGCMVQKLEKTSTGLFKVTLKMQVGQSQENHLYAKTVVSATGSNQILSVPTWARQIPSQLLQLRAEDWEQALELPKTAKVLVVGDGAWGRLVAFELAQHFKVALACGKARKLSPKKILGRSIFCWLDWLGVLRADKQSWMGKFLQKREPIPMAYANNRALRRMGVDIFARALNVNPTGEIMFSCGGKQRVDALVWCAGYREDNTWMQLSPEGQALLLEGRGRCEQTPGLFVLGRKWMTCKASELIMGAENDARLILGYIYDHLNSMPASTTQIAVEKPVEYDHA